MSSEYEILDKEGRSAYKKTGVPMGAKDIPDVVEKSRKKDKGNPSRPPKKWWNEHFAKIKLMVKVKNPNAPPQWINDHTAKILGDIWHNKLSDAQRNKISSEEKPVKIDGPVRHDNLSEHLKEIYDFVVELESKLSSNEYSDEYMIDKIIPQYITLIQNELSNINIIRGMKKDPWAEFDLKAAKLDKSIEETKALLMKYKRE